MLVANGKEEVYIQNRAVLMFGYLVVLIIMIKVTEVSVFPSYVMLLQIRTIENSRTREHRWQNDGKDRLTA
jgi:hypothetical protein